MHRAGFILPILFLLAAPPATSQMVSDTDSSGAAPGAFESGSDFVENNGLAVRVLFISQPAGTQRTVSVEMKNTRDEAVWLAVIGPAPTAIDTQGSTYQVVQIAGVGTCKSLQTTHIDNCMRNSSSYLPGTVFSVLAPGSSSLINITLDTKGAAGATQGFMSLTMNAAMGIGDQPAPSGERGLVSVPISFPLIPLEAQ